ncbi:hypothetical protein LOD99_12602 [Oopsacas minuta]|uniref:AFG1-like ATPase n=1 Tax=Oopsacas minuta TaxID=111878 RepID=A0AAV7JCK8_9METZ|nr:hypothetical protein LOD99_12602 [Oopsacas minuta]
MIAQSSLTKTYQKLVQSNKLLHDPIQLHAITRLQALANTIIQQNSTSKNWIQRALSAVIRSNTSKGLYLYGDVGVGKTMIMDLFYESIPLEKKKRTHFSKFMLEVHSRIHRERLLQPINQLREQNRTNIASLSTFRQDPVNPVAVSLSEETTLLCFDEFQVTDIADAMILRSLFTELFKRGVIVVATSNRAPEDLYKHGLQRSSFLHFIPVLREYCEIHRMTSDTDYRLIGTQDNTRTYFNLTENKSISYNDMFKRAVKKEGVEVRTSKLEFLGRELQIPESCGGVARFNFTELCEGKHSAADYLQICQYYRTVFISGVPRMGRNDRDPARRFITLIDMFYDNRVYLVISSAVDIEELFDLSGWNIVNTNQELNHTNRELEDELQDRGGSVTTKSLFTGEEERFAARRTLSRLRDMQSKQYKEETGIQF